MPYGSMAKQTPVPRNALLDVPDGIDDAVAAAMGSCGLAAWLALTRGARFAPGETVLVSAQPARWAGAVQAARVVGARRRRRRGTGRRAPRLTPGAGS
jgi:NADPH:quinone reductase-like Zn-dependent oxidoreductase